MCGRLAKIVVMGEKPPVLPPGYSVCGGRLTYNQEWDKTVELQSDSKERIEDF